MYCVEVGTEKILASTGVKCYQENHTAVALVSWVLIVIASTDLAAHETDYGTLSKRHLLRKNNEGAVGFFVTLP